MMTRNRTRSLSAALVPLAFAACSVDDNQSLTLEHFVTTTQSSMCVADPSVLFYQTDGLLDVGLIYELGDNNAIGYVLLPVVQNNIPERTLTMQVERDNVTVTGFDVQLQNSGGNDLPFQVRITPTSAPSARPQFTVGSALGVLAPAGGKAAAFLEVLNKFVALQINALDDKTWGAWDKIVVAHVRANGDHSGDALHSAYLDFPITICKNCLFSPPAPLCSSLTVVTNMGSCFPAQDVPVTCCEQQQDGPLFCGPVIPLGGGVDAGTSGDGTPDLSAG